MSIFTGRELEFIASLNTSWRRLYFTELARLLEEDDSRSGCDERLRFARPGMTVHRRPCERRDP